MTIRDARANLESPPVGCFRFIQPMERIVGGRRNGQGFGIERVLRERGLDAVSASSVDRLRS